MPAEVYEEFRRNSASFHSQAASFAGRERATAEVRQVWEGNLAEEVDGIVGALESSAYAAVDTEFPGFVRQTPRSASSSERYEDVRCNVDSMKIVQLGMSFFDSDGRRRRTWEINFRDFDISSPSDARWEPSVQLLKKSGIDFEKTRRAGVDSAVLSGLLRRFDWAGPRKPVWVTFQGLYDVAYLVKLLTRAPLPPTLRGFARLVGETLGRVVDVKHMSGSHLGLVALSRSLGLTMDGTSAHQAGADSLLTGKAFSRVAERMGGLAGAAAFEGILAGIEEEMIVPPGSERRCGQMGMQMGNDEERIAPPARQFDPPVELMLPPVHMLVGADGFPQSCWSFCPPRELHRFPATHFPPQYAGAWPHHHHHPPHYYPAPGHPYQYRPEPPWFFYPYSSYAPM